jgi:hypothetical protein
MKVFMNGLLLAFSIIKKLSSSSASDLPNSSLRRARDSKEKANALLEKMTLEEKIMMLHGSSSPSYSEGGSYVGYVPGNTRLV